ncbi:hydrogenase iron-sulfur subunit [Alcaligenaceae bacterium CGII-47]|nr:hydrogenase iron-sulfur subunit [Alcaligenaceae bacterium CGII-47]
MSYYSTRGFRQAGLTGWRTIERYFDTAFGSALNPLRHLGTIGFLALWLLVASGVILFAFFDTSVSGAWRSVENLAHLPLGLGRLLRGLHHYAADLLMLGVLLHILREWLHSHASGVRHFHWLTGVPLLGFCFISAIGGFWLAWDQLSQYSALSTAEWLDGLPLLASPLARNFLTPTALSDRMFSLFIFVHVGIPLLMLFGLWFHVQRLAHVTTLPPRRLTLGVILTLAVLALVRPVLSHGPGTLDQVPTSLRLDWLLLWLHPLTDATSRSFTLMLLGIIALLLFALPFLSRAPRAAIAVVDAENCSGCTYCFADCPYAAVTMVPHPGRRPGHLLAQVDADLCIGCGICAGACPASTPFRKTQPLVTGIDMPQRSIDSLRQQLRTQLTASTAERPLVVFSCQHGASDAGLRDDDLSVLSLLCAGQLPPSFVEYAMRNGAAGVLVAACCEGGCEFRLGQRWTVQRLARQREPHLRAQAPTEQLQLVFAGPGEEGLLGKAVLGLRERVRAISPLIRMDSDENCY